MAGRRIAYETPEAMSAFLETLRADPGNSEAHAYVNLIAREMEAERQAVIRSHRLQMLGDASRELEQQRRDAKAVRHLAGKDGQLIGTPVDFPEKFAHIGIGFRRILPRLPSHYIDRKEGARFALQKWKIAVDEIEDRLTVRPVADAGADHDLVDIGAG